MTLFNDLNDFNPQDQELLNNLAQSGAMLYFDEVQAGINEPNPLDAVKKSGKLGDISREIIQNSPFGEESLFAPVAYIVEKKWIYGIVSSNNGNELIQKYKEYDKTLEESYGYGDNEKDFIIYIETKGRLNFNNVVFIKMSKAMRNYIATLKDRNALYEKFSKEIVSQLDRNNDYAKPFVSEQNLINAFVVEMEYREIKSFDIDNSNHTPSEFLSKVFNHLSDTIRGFKISEEYWNPQLKSDKYLMTPLLLPSLNTEKAARALYIVSLLPNSHKNKVLPLINIAIQFAKAIDSVYTILKETSEKSKLLFAFYCGVINGTLELLTGIIDMLLIIIELLLKTELNTSAENRLLLESLIEIFENLGEEFLKNPNFLGEAIKKAVSDYFDKRYDRSNFSYVVAHNMGEDLILTVDIIISIVSVVKGLAGLARRAPKFVNWIDDAVRRNPNLAKYLDELPERKLLNDVDSGKRNLDEFADGRKRKYGDNTAYSNYGEIKARLFFEDNTFKIGDNTGTLKYISLDKVTDLDAPIRKGIDAVYEFSTPPPKYIITEVKMNTKGYKGWKPTIDKTVTKSGGSQMTDKWIKFNLEEAVSEEVFQDILLNGYERILVGVSKENDMILETLDKTGKTTNNIINVAK